MSHFTRSFHYDWQYFLEIFTQYGENTLDTIFNTTIYFKLIWQGSFFLFHRFMPVTMKRALIDRDRGGKAEFIATK